MSIILVLIIEPYQNHVSSDSAKGVWGYARFWQLVTLQNKKKLLEETSNSSNKSSVAFFFRYLFHKESHRWLISRNVPVKTCTIDYLALCKLIIFALTLLQWFDFTAGWCHCVVFLGKTPKSTVPHSTQVHKWLPANLMLGVTLKQTSFPYRTLQGEVG